MIKKYIVDGWIDRFRLVRASSGVVEDWRNSVVRSPASHLYTSFMQAVVLSRCCPDVWSSRLPTDCKVAIFRDWGRRRVSY